MDELRLGFEKHKVKNIEDYGYRLFIYRKKRTEFHINKMLELLKLRLQKENAS